MDQCTKCFGFDVLTAPVSQFDRRGLSQAWYSALRLALNTRPSSALAPGSSPKAASVRALTSLVAGGCALRGSVTPLRSRAPRPSRATSESIGERAASHLSLARKIELAFLQPRCPRRHVTFTLKDLPGRVHVTMQTQGSSVRLIAVCAPHVKAHVAKALDDARYALAKRALHLDVTVQERVR